MTKMTKGTTHRVSIKDVVFKADKENEPVLTVKSGDVVIFECRDAFNQVIQKLYINRLLWRTV